MSKKRINKLIISCLTAMLGSACTDSTPDEQKGREDFSLQIFPQVTNVVVNSRTPVNETVIKKGDVGISIFPQDGYNTDKGIDGSTLYEPIPEYKRIRMSIDGNTCTYTTTEASESPAIYLKKNAGAVDLYAYYPYTTTLTYNLDKIPFTIGKNKDTNFDYMVPNGGKRTVDPMDNDNKDKNTCSIPIEFKHIMTQLEFRVTPSFWGQDLLPTFILYTKDANDLVTPVSKIATQGTYSCIDGSMQYSKYESTFAYTGDYIDATTSLTTSKQGFVIPPIEWKSGEPEVSLFIEIRFNRTTPSPVQTEPYAFNLKDWPVTDGGTTRYGLLPGYKYVINATIDNFVKYSGVPSRVEWTDVPMDFPI